VGPDPEFGEFSSKRFLETVRGEPGSDADKTVRIEVEYLNGNSN
jgi:hypothetical protein